MRNCPYLYIKKKAPWNWLQKHIENSQVVCKIKLKLKFNYQMHFETFRKVIKHRNNWKRIFYSRHLLRSNSNSATFERGTSSQMAIWYGSTTRLAVHRESTNPAELYNYLSNERLSYFSWIQGFGSTLRTWTNVKVSRNKELPPARAYKTRTNWKMNRTIHPLSPIYRSVNSPKIVALGVTI